MLLVGTNGQTSSAATDERVGKSVALGSECTEMDMRWSKGNNVVPS